MRKGEAGDGHQSATFLRVQQFSVSFAGDCFVANAPRNDILLSTFISTLKQGRPINSPDPVLNCYEA